MGKYKTFVRNAYKDPTQIQHMVGQMEQDE
jgi:hypothetical protein